MSYAIGYVIYGYNGNDENLLKHFSDEQKEEFQEGCESYYSAGGPGPCFLGVKLSEFDECTDLKLTALAKLLEKNVEEKFQKKFDKLPIEFVRLIEKSKVKPDYWVIWGSS